MRQQKSCFLCSPCRGTIKKTKKTKSVEFRDASLPEYKLESRGTETSELLNAVHFMCALVPRYFECVIQ
jgi:hypothetical protein